MLQQELLFMTPDEAAHLKKVFAESGIKGLWRDELKYLLEDAGRRERSQFWLGSLYARLGEKDKAFESLNKALDRRNIRLTYFVADPRYDSLRSDPRYEEILRRVGLRK